MNFRTVLSVADAERRRDQHRYVATRRQRALLLVAGVVFLPVGLGILTGMHGLGRTVARGETAVLRAARWYLPVVLLLIGFFGAVNANNKLLGFEARKLLLTTVPTRELVYGLLAADALSWSIGVILPIAAATAAFGVGTGSPPTVLIATLAMVLVALAAILVGVSVGLAARLALRRVPISQRTRSLAATAGQIAGVLVGGAAGALGGQRAEAAADAGLGALVPTGPPPVPLGYYGDWLFVGTPTFEGVTALNVASLAVVACSVPASVVAIHRFTARLWYTDPELPTDSDSGTAESGTDWIGDRSGAGLIAAGLLRRAVRDPLRYAHVAYYLIGLGMFGVAAVSNLDAAGFIIGFVLVVLGVLLSGGLFGLNQLGEEGAMLGQMVLSATKPAAFVRGRVIAGLVVGLPLIVLGSVAMLLGGLAPVDAAVLIPFWCVTAVVSATAALGLGTLFPRTEPGTVLDRAETLPPALLTIGVHGVLLATLTTAGTVLLAFPLGGRIRLAGAFGLALLSVVVGDGGYRYAVTGIADHGRTRRPGRAFDIELSVGLALLGLVASNSAVLAVYGYFPFDGTARFVTAFVASYVGYTAVAAAYVMASDGEWSAFGIRLPTRADVRPLLVGLVASLGAWGGLMAGVTLFEIPVAQHSIAGDIATGGPAVALVLVALALLVNGPIEELFFRGVIQTHLADAFETRVAIPVAAVVFSLVHVPAYATGPIPAMAVTLTLLAVLGGIWGWVYARTDSVVPAALCHGVYNAALFGVVYLSVL